MGSIDQIGFVFVIRSDRQKSRRLFFSGMIARSRLLIHSPQAVIGFGFLIRVWRSSTSLRGCFDVFDLVARAISIRRRIASEWDGLSFCCLARLSIGSQLKWIEFQADTGQKDHDPIRKNC
jgi:hypothetical protein